LKGLERNIHPEDLIDGPHAPRQVKRRRAIQGMVGKLLMNRAIGAIGRTLSKSGNTQKR